MTTFTSRNVPMIEGTDPADIAARVNPVAQLAHDRPGVSALTTTQRNALTGAELWDGRVILNTTTDRLNRYDLGTTSWVAVADFSEIAALLATTGTPAQDGTASRGVSTSAARADHVHPVPAWQSYTPTISGSGTTGAGATLVGRYVQHGKTVHYRAYLALGTGFTAGVWNVSLPVTRAGGANAAVLNLVNVLFEDVGSNFYRGFGVYNGDSVSAYTTASANGAGASCSATVPFTWAAGDTLHWAGTYEAS